jgi:ABC-type lipoprotein release transport system permease subunit
MKDTIRQQWTDIWGELTYGLRYLCLKPSPMKRFISVLILCVALGGANIYIVVNAIYNIGKRDAQKEFLELKHINDSINQLKQQKYGQQSIE